MLRRFLIVVTIVFFGLAVNDVSAAEKKPAAIEQKRAELKEKSLKGVDPCVICVEGVSEAIKEACIAGTCIGAELVFDGICEAILAETVVGIPVCPIAGLILDAACEGAGIAFVKVNTIPLARQACKKVGICK